MKLRVKSKACLFVLNQNLKNKIKRFFYYNLYNVLNACVMILNNPYI